MQVMQNLPGAVVGSPYAPTRAVSRLRWPAGQEN